MTTRNLILYAIASLFLMADSIMISGIEGIGLFFYFLLPVLGVSAVMVLLCVLLWKKQVKISGNEMFYFVAYYAAIPYCAFSGSVLVIFLLGYLF